MDSPGSGFDDVMPPAAVTPSAPGFVGVESAVKPATNAAEFFLSFAAAFAFMAEARW